MFGEQPLRRLAQAVTKAGDIVGRQNAGHETPIARIIIYDINLYDEVFNRR
jgi:hypothetical protein